MEPPEETALSSQSAPPPFTNVEDIIRHVDRRGRWQLWTTVKASILVFGTSTILYAHTYFFVGKMQPECVSYATTSAYTTNNVFINNDTTRDACSVPTDGDGTAAARCTEWKYSSPHYDNTLVSEFNLVCERTYLVPMYQSSMVWGQLLGLPLWGALSDRFGRLSTLRLTYLGFLLTTLASTFMQSLTWIIVLRVLAGFMTSATWNACFVMCMELSVPERRKSAGIYVGTGWPVGAATASLLAYFVRDWRTLGRATVAVAVVTALPFLFFLDESPRWLVMHKKFEQARRMLESRRKKVGGDEKDTSLPKDTLYLQAVYRRHMEEVSGTNSTATQLRQMRQLLTERRLRIRTLVLTVVWAAVAFVFHGIIYYGTGSLPLSPMLTLGLMSMLRTFTQPLYVWLSDRYGCRDVMIAGYALCGVGLLCLAFLPMRGPTAVLYIVLYLTVFVGIDCSLSVIYIVTGELYPTMLRQSSLGVFSLMGRVGAMIAPFIATLAAQYWLPLPALIYGVVCVIATLCSLVLPRADDAALPETVAEAEQIRSMTGSRGRDL